MEIISYFFLLFLSLVFFYSFSFTRGIKKMNDKFIIKSKFVVDVNLRRNLYADRQTHTHIYFKSLDNPIKLHSKNLNLKVNKNKRTMTCYNEMKYIHVYIYIYVEQQMQKKNVLLRFELSFSFLFS